MATITPDLIRSHQLTEEEYQKIVSILGREPSYTELGIFSVMWSEHCSYKSSRLHLKKLPTRSKLVLQGPGENAGIIDIGGGYAIAFKIESHNHPSFIEPFQGAATGVGGILRDIFTMGARPVAVMDSLRFGPLDDAQAGARNKRIVEGVVAGIAHYGNCFGVPTVGGECLFEPGYNGNPLVNVFALGVFKKDEIFLAQASGVGNPVIYVGAKTGRDGIHGASMASAEFTEESQQKRPNVQVGDPFMEKLLLEACLEAMRTGAIVGIQDMGAAGLTCSTCEMGSRGRRRHRDRPEARPAAGDRHDPLRDHAFGVPGTHAAGGRQGPRGRSLPGLPQVGPGRGDRGPGDRRWHDARPQPRQGRGRDPEQATGRRCAPLRPAARRAAAHRPSGRATLLERRSGGRSGDRARFRRCMLQALDLGAVRLHGAHQHGAGPRRRRSRDPHQGDRDLRGDGARRQRPLLFAGTAGRRAAGGGRVLPQPLDGGRAARGGHQLPQFRQPGAPRDHGPVSGGHRGHGRSLPLLSRRPSPAAT